MSKLNAKGAYELTEYIGQTFGPSEWITIDQKMINEFADVTRDWGWHHVNVERAKTDMPEGKTMAHGLLTLALVPGLFMSLMNFTEEGGKYGSLNYGYDRVRFLAPVRVGARIRLSGEVIGAEPKGSSILGRVKLVVEMEGAEKPALTLEQVMLGFLAENRPGMNG